MGEEIELSINADKLKDELDEIEKKREQIEAESIKTIKFVEKESKITFRKVIQLSKTAWHIVDNIMQAAGTALPAELRLLINAAFSAINILQPIIAAEAVTPGMQVQASIGALQLSLAGMAIQQAQGQAESLENMFDMMHALRGLDTMIGFLEFL